MVGYERGLYNGISDGVGVGKVEGYKLGDLLGSDGGSEIRSSGGI